MEVSPQQPAVGFLTVVHQPDLGHVGGLLLLDLRARPLEFHCTAAVQPNRAQEILYGPTLRSYLYGEQIATALLKQCRLKPQLIVTDLAEVTESRAHVSAPVVWMQACDESSGQPSSGQPSKSRNTRLDAAPAARGWRQLRVGPHAVAVPEQYAADESRLQRLPPAVSEIDLTEPFERIREAIREAQSA